MSKPLQLFTALVILQLAVPAYSDICTQAVCQFQLVVSRRRTMTWTNRTNGYTFSVGLEGTDRLVLEESLFRIQEDYPQYIGMNVPADEVITADGYPRGLMVINGQFPGPTLEVLQDATVEVEVVNELLTEGFTIHWHGMHQQGTPYMDGTPGVNQCPIHPHQKFTYRFRADPPGTHWYHGHHGFQRIEGLIGMLIVHPSMPSLPYFSLTVTDWFHADGHEIETSHPCGMYIKGHGDFTLPDHLRHFSIDNIELSASDYTSTLLDGRGRWQDQPYPLTKYDVQVGQTYLFRMVNAAGEFSYEITVDDHQLTVTASDGHDLEATTVDILIIHPGERKDFTVTISPNAPRYWMRAQTLNRDRTTFQGSFAILATDVGAYDPSTREIECTVDSPCIVYNCPFPFYPPDHYKTCISLHDVYSTYTEEWLDTTFGTKDPNPMEIFINFASTSAASVNARRFRLPRAPVHQLDGTNIADYVYACDEQECEEECTCTYVITLPADTTIQMVLLSYDNIDFHHHVAHSHGHAFAVMKMGYFTADPVTAEYVGRNQDIKCWGTYCSVASWNISAPTDLNDINPPVKDSVIIPTNGYVVTRFRTTNPGYWILHCHQETHVLEGMAVVFDEAPGQHPPLPSDFPKCWDWKLNIKETD